jgi:hypothetical protein
VRQGAEDAAWDKEYGRDVWRLRELGIKDRGIAHITFTGIPQPWLKNLAKRWARWRLSTGQVAETAALSVLAVRRFAAFLASPAVNVDQLAQLDRSLLERYLAYLHATFGGRMVHRNMIGQLNLFFTAIRQHGWDSTLPTNAMFFPEDFPKQPEWLPRALSEHVMAQLERPDNLKRWNIPAYQLVTLILMRCGLRVTDALGLPGDCIVRDANGAPYLRYYNHKMRREALVRSMRNWNAPSANTASACGPDGLRELRGCSRNSATTPAGSGPSVTAPTARRCTAGWNAAISATNTAGPST